MIPSNAILSKAIDTATKATKGKFTKFDKYKKRKIMGRDPEFKVKHNLKTSSIEVLVADLEQKFKCKVEPFMHDYVEEEAKKLNVDISSYNGKSKAKDDKTMIFVEEDLLIARSLVKKYGEQTKRKLIKSRLVSKYDKIIDDIEEVEDGVIRYKIYLDSSLKTENDISFVINSESIAGDFSFCLRWSMFRVIFCEGGEYNEDNLAEFIEFRKKLYKLMQPIIGEMPIYYHADQGDMQLLYFKDRMEDFEQAIKEYNLKTFNISDYILNPDSSLCDNAYYTVFVDDMKDIYG